MIALAGYPLMLHAQETLVVTPSTDVNLSEKNIQIKVINPSVAENFKSGELDKKAVKFLQPNDFFKVDGVVLLDFETKNGFLDSTINIADDGTVWQRVFDKMDKKNVTGSRVEQFEIKDGTWLHKVNVEWRAYDAEQKTFIEKNAHEGAFLVRDRSLHDTVSSGSQGIMALPISTIVKPQFPAGIVFTPDAEFSGFSCVFNNQSGGYGFSIIALDAEGKILFSYGLGIGKGNPVYVAFRVDKTPIHSVWVGQLFGGDGTIIDDVAFLPAK